MSTTINKVSIIQWMKELLHICEGLEEVSEHELYDSKLAFAIILAQNLNDKLEDKEYENFSDQEELEELLLEPDVLSGIIEICSENNHNKKGIVLMKLLSNISVYIRLNTVKSSHK